MNELTDDYDYDYDYEYGLRSGFPAARLLRRHTEVPLVLVLVVVVVLVIVR
jgi:hypothetical protein